MATSGRPHFNLQYKFSKPCKESTLSFCNLPHFLPTTLERCPLRESGISITDSSAALVLHPFAFVLWPSFVSKAKYRKIALSSFVLLRMNHLVLSALGFTLVWPALVRYFWGCKPRRRPTFRGIDKFLNHSTYFVSSVMVMILIVSRLWLQHHSPEVLRNSARKQKQTNDVVSSLPSTYSYQACGSRVQSLLGTFVVAYMYVPLTNPWAIFGQLATVRKSFANSSLKCYIVWTFSYQWAYMEKVQPCLSVQCEW